MPVKETSPVRGKPDQIRTEFEESEEMSTYLVAFVICDFDSIQNTTTSNVTIRVITPPHKIEQAKFALEQATLITENYENYFGVPYPLPKQDLIAIPDFAAGAMENWGLITYRETSLLYEENGSSTKAQQWVAIVIAHELAHQWFGNLVTMRWWNDLWLNEGFASWMEYKGVNETKPEWRMMDQFWGAAVQHALSLDALQSSHPISVPVNDPKDIEGIFDGISYKKGSSIIHMLEQFIGEPFLRKGLELYLTRHKFKSAVTNDLWSALSEATNHTKDVEGMMKTWTLQMGYPLISISQVENSSDWEVQQTRFLLAAQLNGTNMSYPESRFNYSWVVPFDLMTDSGATHSLLLSNEVNRTGGTVVLDEGLKWIKANLGGHGFYRVNYPSQIWVELVNQLVEDHTVFGATDRAQLIDDAFALCMAGIVPHSIPLRMSTYLAKETDLLPWSVALRQLSSWRTLLRETVGRVLMDELVKGLMKNIYNKLGWNDEGEHVDRLLRYEILETALEVGLEDAVNTSTSFYADLRAGGHKLPAEFKELVYCRGMQEGDRTDWNWAFKQYTETSIPSLRGSILKALTCTRDVYILQEFLDMCFNTSQVRSQDVRTLLGEVSRNPTGTLLSWRHFRANWDRYFSMFGHGSFTMGSIIHELTSSFSTHFDLQQVEEFFHDRETGPGHRSLLQSIEKIKVNIAFRENCENSIIEWLEQYKNFSS